MAEYSKNINAKNKTLWRYLIDCEFDKIPYILNLTGTCSVDFEIPVDIADFKPSITYLSSVHRDDTALFP